MMKQYFTELETGLQTAISEGQASIRKVYSLEIARLGKKLYSGDKNVAWCGIAAPFDLFNAMDLTSCFVEFIGAMVASTGVAGEIIEESEHIGYSSDACSYHRAVMGATLKGLMPAPEFMIGTTCPCSGGLAVIENLSTHFGKKLYVLHIPQDESGRNVHFLVEQFKDVVDDIGHITGKPLDKERLCMAMEKTNQARDIMASVFNLAKAIPSPVRNKDLSNFGISMALFLGEDGAVNVAKAFQNEYQNRVANSNGEASSEKYRLLWIQNRIQFKNPLEMLLENEYGAKIVIDELNSITWDPIDMDDIYAGLAKRAISNPFNGPIEKRIENLQKLAIDYQVDGAINPCNWGCRQGGGARGLIEEGLKKIGVPTLNLEVDCIDSRKFTEGQMKTRIEAFIEMLAQRK